MIDLIHMQKKNSTFWKYLSSFAMLVVWGTLPHVTTALRSQYTLNIATSPASATRWQPLKLHACMEAPGNHSGHEPLALLKKQINMFQNWYDRNTTCAITYGCICIMHHGQYYQPKNNGKKTYSTTNVITTPTCQFRASILGICSYVKPWRGAKAKLMEFQPNERRCQP
jgi:hypothetical protein